MKEKSYMENRARHGFPTLALALVATLAGCKTEWDRRDEDWLGGKFDAHATLEIEKRITSFRPGQSSLADVEQTLGALVNPHDSEREADRKCFRTWNDRGRGWQFTFSDAGVLKSFSRTMHTCCLVFDDAASADDFDRWFVDRLGFNPVPPERAAGFKPGVTKQEHVIAVWGACARGYAIDSGGFSMCWGSMDDYWMLQFDTNGVLVAEPRHTERGLGG